MDQNLSEKELIEVLEKGEKKISELKEQKEKLLTSNQELIELVEELEEELEKEGKRTEIEGYEYSYSEGWQPSEEISEQIMELGKDPEVESINSQLKEIIRNLKELDNLKKRD